LKASGRGWASSACPLRERPRAPRRAGRSLFSIRACHTPTGGLSVFDTLFPALGELIVLADGRLIWLKYEICPRVRTRCRRVCSNNVSHPRASSSCGPKRARRSVRAYLSIAAPRGTTNTYAVYAGEWADARSLRVDDEHLARVIDPWSGYRQPPGRTQRSGPTCHPRTWSRSRGQIT
jgi:hypothetical protein